MSIVFYCDRCNEKITVADNLEGQHVQCPVCEFGVTVPTERSPQPGSEPGAVPAPVTPSGRGGHVTHPDATASRLTGFVGWSAIVVGVIGIVAGIIHIAHAPAVGEGNLLYFWTLTLLPGIAALLLGILVLAVRSWFRHFARLLARPDLARENRCSGKPLKDSATGSE